MDGIRRGFLWDYLPVTKPVGNTRVAVAYLKLKRNSRPTAQTSQTAHRASKLSEIFESTEICKGGCLSSLLTEFRNKYRKGL